MLTGGVNNTLIKSIGGFLGCYPMKEHVLNGHDIFSLCEENELCLFITIQMFVSFLVMQCMLPKYMI